MMLSNSVLFMHGSYTRFVSSFLIMAGIYQLFVEKIWRHYGKIVGFYFSG